MGKTVLTRVGDANIENPSVPSPARVRLAQGMAQAPGAAVLRHPGPPAPVGRAGAWRNSSSMLDLADGAEGRFHDAFGTRRHAAGSRSRSARCRRPRNPIPAPAPATASATAAALPPGKAGRRESGHERRLSPAEMKPAGGSTGWKAPRRTTRSRPIEGGKHALHITVPTAADKRYYVQLMATKRLSPWRPTRRTR